MTPPPPRPDDETPPPPVAPAAGWEVVEPVAPPSPRDPLLDDPLFAELVEAKPLPDLKLEPATPPPLPVAEPAEAIPVAEEAPPLPRAVPVATPRPRPPEASQFRPRPAPAQREDATADQPRPRVLMACSVVGCFGLTLLAALGFLAYAAIALLSGIAESRTPRSGQLLRPEPVAPTAGLAGQRITINLTGVVDGVGRAAGGRFLLMRVPRTNQVLVFDPNVAQLAKTIEVGEPGALFAGSASRMFVYRPNARGQELESWNLVTGLKEQTASKPTGVVQPDALVTGAGVDGPVYLVSVPTNGTANVRVLDPDTLAETGSYPVPGWRIGDQRVHVRASDDGTLLGVTTADGAQLVRIVPPAPLSMVGLRGGARQSVFLATPAHDAQQMYTSHGVYDLAGSRKFTGTPYSFPAAHGSGLFLSYRREVITGKLTDPVRIHLADNPDIAVELPDVQAPPGLLASDTGDLPPDQRVHLWPAAGLAAVIRTQAAGQSQLDVRKVDVPKLFEDLEKPYLLFGSEPRLWAVRGEEWRYSPVVWTNAKAVPVPAKVVGPRGMAARNGEFAWTPGPGDASADVVLRVRSGEETVEQRFRITVIDDEDDD